MSPEDHNRLLGWAHIAHASFYSLIGLLCGAMFGLAGLTAGLDPKSPNDFSAGFFVLFGLVFGLLYVVLSLPSFVAGIALLKRKPWARIAAIVGGSLSAASFPFGTAVCVYTYWFMFSEPGRSLYDKSSKGFQPHPDRLYGAPASVEWDKRGTKTAEYEYVPPPEPPDWRGDG